MIGTLSILETGLLTLVEDLGRPGYAALGLGRSGAADRTSYLLGQRLVGHVEPRAALEVTFGGLVLRADHLLVLALTGADAEAMLDGAPAPYAAPFVMEAGQELALGTPGAGWNASSIRRSGCSRPPGHRASPATARAGRPPSRCDRGG